MAKLQRFSETTKYFCIYFSTVLFFYHHSVSLRMKAAYCKGIATADAMDATNISAELELSMHTQ